jgi:phosphotransferase system HPr (HPr) family protein
VADAPKVVERVVQIVNEAGFHLRPVAKFAELAKKYQSSVCVDNDGQKADGKSPMQMAALGVRRGSRLVITATGSDAEEVVRALEKLIADGFVENEN